MSGTSVQPLLLTQATLDLLTTIPVPVRSSLIEQFELFRASIAPGLLEAESRKQLDRRLNAVLGRATIWRYTYVETISKLLNELDDLEAFFKEAGDYVLSHAVPTIAQKWGEAAGQSFREAWIYEYRILRLVTADVNRFTRLVMAMPAAKRMAIEESSTKADVLMTCVAMAAEGELTDWTAQGGRAACRASAQMARERYATIQSMIGVIDLVNVQRTLPQPSLEQAIIHG